MSLKFMGNIYAADINVDLAGIRSFSKRVLMEKR